MKNVTLLLILVSVLLASCQAAGSQSSTSAIQTPQVGKLTVTPGLQTPTETSSKTTTQPSPMQVAATVLSKFEFDVEEHISPDGLCRWERMIAYPLDFARDAYEDNFFIRVTLTCYDEGETRFTLVSRWQLMALGYTLPTLLGWSQDSQGLFYYENIIPDGCQPLGGYRQGLRFVELPGGAVQDIPLVWTGGLSLSPDGHRLAYYKQKEGQVGIFDLQTNHELQASMRLPSNVSTWWAGDFTWSPESGSVMFAAVYDDPCFPSGAAFHRIDLPSGEIFTLYETPKPDVRILAWLDPGRVSVSINNELYWLDPGSGELTSQPQ